MGTGASSISADHQGYKRITVTISTQTDPWISPSEEVGATQVSSAPEVTPKAADPVEETWTAICETLDVPEGGNSPNSNLVVKRTGWKTIRIFVSSTFKDFHQEREILVKEVFPDLRVWCEERRLHLVECDLRWGVPKDTTTELTLRTCLGEIDRCYHDNVMPYFLNMTSERIGWIPEPGNVPQCLVDEYRWVFGMSVTEMEIMHGAYRKDNPNSLFLVRDDKFLEKVPKAQREIFLDENPIAPAKLEKLRQKLKERFPECRVIPYTCQYVGMDSRTDKPKLDIDSDFREKVMAFFKDRISQQYPFTDEKVDPQQRAREAHEAFMRSRCEQVLGRADIISQIVDYVGTGGCTPLMILGGPGTGKSSIMSRAAAEISTLAINNKVPGPDSKGKHWHVFYHFVGAVPGSTDLRDMLLRLLTEIKVIDETNIPTDQESTVQLAASALNNDNTSPVIILIDAVNQFDEDKYSTLVTWLPRKLSPNVRCVLSMIQDTPQHKSLMSRESKPSQTIVPPLSLTIRMRMVAEYLGKFNKRLDMEQMFMLLSKKSSENPLWLSIACEELRVSGQFRTLEAFIGDLADGLLELIQQVLARFEQEGGGSLLVYTLCLMEVSATGLLESELLSLLSLEEKLAPPQEGDEKGKKEKPEKNKGKRHTEKLPAYKWANVYRSLRPFLRPFGNSGEGRLDFYHRTVSKAVRKKYLKSAPTEDGTLSPIYRWWHTKLADFFEVSDNYDRKCEEYAYHLIKLHEIRRLEAFITDWTVFERLYDRDHSGTLLQYWNECGGKDRVLEFYSEELQILQKEESGVSHDVMADRLTKLARFLVQFGDYTFSDDLAQRALQLEEEHLGKRSEQMAEIYSTIAQLHKEKNKQNPYLDESQVPAQMVSVKYNQLAVDILETMTDSKYKHKLYHQKSSLAFALSTLSELGGSEEIPAAVAHKKGLETCEESIEGFRKLGNKGKMAEAIMTKAILHKEMEGGNEIKLYEEALDLSLQTYGRFHVTTARINFNAAICYEQKNQYDKAYDLFKENFIIKKEIFGVDHIKFHQAREVFEEPWYKQIMIGRREQDFFG